MKKMILPIVSLLIAISALLTGCSSAQAQNQPKTAVPDKKNLKLGMIGLDTSHVIIFPKQLGSPAKRPEKDLNCRIVAGFPGGSPDMPISAGRVEKYTKQLRDEFGLEIVGSIEELCRKVDGILLTSVDGRPHLKQVRQVIAAGIPVFVDKPMASDLKDVIAIFNLAKENNVPCWSSSSLRFSSQNALLTDKDKIGNIIGCDTYGPFSIKEHFPDMFWYGIHGIELLYSVMGPGCETVRRIQADKCELVIGIWKDGRIGTYRGVYDGPYEFGLKVYGTKGNIAIKRKSDWFLMAEEMVKFFETSKPPVPADETIEIFAFMTAADESKAKNGDPVSIQSIIDKAEKELKESSKQ